MPLLLGAPSKKASSIAPELSARGINLLRLTPSTIRFTSMPTKHQPAFLQYLAVLPAYMEACQRNMLTDTRDPCHPVSFPFKDSLPIVMPNLVVSPKKDQDSLHQTLLELGGSVQIINNKKVYQFEHPSKESIVTILKMKADEKAQASDGFMNIAAFNSYRLVMRILSEFLQVHRYPAYIDQDHMNDHTWGRFNTEWKEEVTAGSKRKAPEEGDEEMEGDSAEPPKKKGPAVAVREHDEAPSTKDYTKGHQWKVKIVTIPSKATIPFAESIDDLPPTHGIWVPYVPSLQFYDADMVPKVINQYFMGSLSTTPLGCTEAWAQLKRDWGVVSKTESGNVLAHIFFCIQIALPAQARAIPLVLGNRYKGCFISGAGYIISVLDIVHRPRPFSQVVPEIEESSTHTPVLKQILTLAGFDVDDDIARDEGYMAVRDKDLTMMRLHKLIVNRKLSNSDRDEIAKLAPSLDFHTSHWGVNGSSIARALLLISRHSDELPPTLPIHHSQLLCRDRTMLVWSCFGFSAPSLWPNGAHEMSMGSKEYTYDRKKKNSSEVETISRPLDHLYVRFVSLKSAVADLEKVRTRKAFGFLSGSALKRESYNADRKIEGDQFTNVLAAMKAFCDYGEKEVVKSTDVVGEEVPAPVENDDDDI